MRPAVCRVIIFIAALFCCASSQAQQMFAPVKLNTSSSYLGEVAARPMINDSEAYPYAMSRAALPFPYSYSGNIQFRLQNFYVDTHNQERGNGAQAGVYPAQTDTASFYDGTTCHQLQWSGVSSITFSTALSPLSDPVSVSMSAGAKGYFYEHSDNSVANLGTPVNTYTEGPGGTNSINTAIGDQFNADPNPSNVPDQTSACPSSITLSGGQQNTSILTPAAVVAVITTQPSACLTGGSVQQGYTAWDNANGDMGVIAMSVGPVMGYIQMATGATTAQDYVSGNNSAVRRSLYAYCTHLINEYAINDVLNGETKAQIEGYLTALYSGFPGVSFQTTATPYTTGSNVATAGGQTTSAYEAVRTALNADFRSGAFMPNGGIFDIESKVATTYSGSVVWKDGATFPACGSSPYWVNTPSTNVHPSLCADEYIQNSGVVDTTRIAW